MATIWMVLTLTVSLNWNVKQIDINNSFLNGNLNEEVFMWQPEGFVRNTQPHHVCRLKKALYGLNQAPYAWYEKLNGILLQGGFKNTKSDNSLFIFKNSSQVLLTLFMLTIFLLQIMIQYWYKRSLTNWIRRFH